MLSETDSIINVLEEISEYALLTSQHQCLDAVETVQAQMETIRQWSDASHEEWSRYYRNVHDFIRLHVRADPNRQAAHRVKEAIQKLAITPWTFSVPKPENFYHFREGEFTRPITPLTVTGKVSRPAIEDSKPIDQTLLNDIKREIGIQISETGKASLVAILQKYTPELDSSERYKAAGELVTLLAAQDYPVAPMNLDWVPLCDNIQVQELTVIGRKRS
jgi:chromosome condensin MukBEF complex kleisin-like MukF subunit